jgi:hypothetical protein
MVMLEAKRIGGWRALAKGLQIETVEEISGETQAGDRRSDGYIVFALDDLDLLRATMKVTEVQRLAFATTYPQVHTYGMDDGERDLVVHALGRSDHWLICTADTAAVRSLVMLGHRERLICLEQLYRSIGQDAMAERVRTHHRTNWLSTKCTEFLFTP